MQFGVKSKSSPQPYAYHAILPLKLLLLKQQDPDRFALMDRLMDHNQNRRKEDSSTKLRRQAMKSFQENIEK